MESKPNETISSAKTEKEVKYLAAGVVTKFQNWALIFMLLTVIGLVLAFAISYAYYKPIIGFALCVICILFSLTFLSIQFNTANYLLSGDMTDNEPSVIESSKIKIFRWLFAAISINVFVLFSSLPFVIVKRDYFEKNTAVGLICLSFIVILGIFIALRKKLKPVFMNGWLFYSFKRFRKMNLTQYGFMIGVVLILLPVLIKSRTINMPIFIIASVSICILCICSIITIIVCASKEKDKQKRFLLIAAGLRNFLCGVSAGVAFIRLCSISHRTSYGTMSVGARNMFNNFDRVWPAYVILIAALATYLAVKYIIVRKFTSSLTHTSAVGRERG